ncbi:LysR family transcriptional regulator [Marinomonas pollencensis]|uniref:DNA-binding transcriptional LysR family regulator n=1 Tax=Marinomonas pollencensis TaxID=491954 RepID=A0A3E0DNI8_9GAMM|nr:LysR family transcriptional regulator [Marinomonas pollencensis]REG84416.1 DNA-binding transcriptional LysR family regulator [Marinomonas pollencensis]
MDRIDAMRTFVSVVTEGSFSRAAEYLQLSPQLVSKYVSQLEEKLNVRLLNRTTRRVSLTEAGIQYLQHAKQILASIDEMEQQLGGLHQNPKGTLRISAPVSFSIKHLAPLLADFQKHYPLIDLDLQLNDRKVDVVEEGFDVVLRIGELKSSSLVAKYVAPIRVILCASPEYLKQHGTPSKPEDLKQHKYLHYSYLEMDERNEVFAWLRSKNVEQGGLFESNNGDVLVEAAIAGAGIALQPTFIAGEAIRKGQLVPLLLDYEPKVMGLYALYAHRKLLASKVRCFIDFLDGYFGTPPYWDAFDKDANSQG